ncbi:SPL family radical SAM protein [Thiovibrio frasassiensis]|uniref:DNA photolyase n=1 Tax=Thiovibrio frasassiensis TaxID=2984131 RepID=A0A9X4RQC4_9BACT|nr:DNA photolyase [Thiovibrio frasassiensis]MDG4476137.1 DNA photolyase [Thiovibrio frasassiensis]
MPHTAKFNPADIIQHLYVEDDCRDLPLTKNILANLPGRTVRVIPPRSGPDLSPATFGPQSLTSGKKHLVLCKNRGRFLKPCPATREYRCCDYQVLNVGMNCPMDCVYCILQAYLNNPWLSFFVNTDDLLAELTTAFAETPQTFRRIGTGEFTDSMALDRVTGLSRILIEFFKDQPNAVLELKSKAVALDNLEHSEHGGRTIMAWSLNSTEIMGKEELRTATLEQRLAAAAQCAEWGYKLAFHFDPLIYHPGWEKGYKETIDRLFATVPAASIVWISMGALRFLPALRGIATSRFPSSRFFHEEFVLGLDNKYRYFRPLRTEMYRFMAEHLSRHLDPDTCLYFCMESDEIWRDVFGFSPEEKGGLPGMLDLAARIKCTPS